MSGDLREGGRGASGGVPVAAVEAAVAATITVGALFLLVAAPRMVAAPARAQPGAFPPYTILLVGAALLAAAGAAWLVRAVGALRRGGSESIVVGEWAEVAVLVALFGASHQLAKVVGLLVASALLYVVLLLVYRERSWRFLVVSCLAYATFIQVAFVEFLRIPLPRSPHLPLPF